MAEFYTFPKKKRFFRINATVLLIIINVVFFLVNIILLSIFGESAYNFLALKPSMIIQGKSLWTLFTSMFIHANLYHLFFNMISLFFLGNLAEKIIGKKRFIIFYLLSGLFAGLFFTTLSVLFGTGIGEKIFGNPSVFGVGASGAIFGLVGILAVLIPKKKIFLVGGPLVAIIFQSVFNAIFPDNPISNVLNLIITIYIFFSIFAIFSFNPKLRKFSLPIEMPFWLVPIIAIVPLVIIGLFVTLPIGNTAHLGGLIVGLLYAVYLKKKYHNKTKYIKSVFK